MSKVLLLYHGVYDHTRRICERLQHVLQQAGVQADVVPLGRDAPSPEGYDTVVIGASIRHGKHNPLVLEFIRVHRAQLESRPSAFFSVSLVARKPTRNTAQTNPYVKAFLASSPWQPALVGVFAGELDYRRYGVFDRTVIRFIMRLTGGPAAPDTKVVFTDWSEVERFGARVALLAGAVSAA
jgi:menaquinone-dependent protoporphyrinogen oxidase